MKCGLKKYTTNVIWATLMGPTDPLNEPFKLKVDTNLILTYEYDIQITIGFYNFGKYPAQITQTVTLYLIHPCKETVISSNQTIPDLQFFFGDPVLQQTFVAFGDSVADQYQQTNLCSLRYLYETTDNVTDVNIEITGLTIKVQTTDQTKINQSYVLYLYGEYPGIQIQASARVQFKV